MKMYIGTILCGAVGFVLIGGALLKIIGNWLFLRLAQTADGTVVGFKTARSSDRHTVYLPVVEFANRANRRFQITGSVAANPPAYRIGDRVTVRFPPKNPRGGRIQSFWELWIVPTICCAVGLTLLGLAFHFLPK